MGDSHLSRRLGRSVNMKLRLAENFIFSLGSLSGSVIVTGVYSWGSRCTPSHDRLLQAPHIVVYVVVLESNDGTY